MKNLTQNELKWLTSINDENVFYISSDFAIGTDGHRFHGINVGEMPDEINELNIGKLIREFDDYKTVDSIIVNPNYLMDALRDMNRPVKLSVSRLSDTKIAIIIEGGARKAIVMCLREEGAV